MILLFHKKNYYKSYEYWAAKDADFFMNIELPMMLIFVPFFGWACKSLGFQWLADHLQLQESWRAMLGKDHSIWSSFKLWGKTMIDYSCKKNVKTVFPFWRGFDMLFLKLNSGSSVFWMVIVMSFYKMANTSIHIVTLWYSHLEVHFFKIIT